MEIKLEKIAIEDEGCHLLLDAKIEGRQLKLVLDTGASRTVVDYSFLSEMNQKDSFELQSDLSVGVGSNQLNSYLVEVQQFEIGNLKIDNYKMACMDLSHIQETYAKLNYPQVHGVLGGDILLQHKAIIDYEQEVLRFVD